MRGRWRLLGRWWFLAAAVTLGVNDHVLKARFPGLATGKLSDFVGPIVVATVLAVVVGRTAAVISVAIGFVALKTVPGVAELVAPVLGGVTLRDATDLVGLVALIPAWHLMRDPHVVDEATEPARPRSSSHDLAAATRRRSLATVGAALALVVTTATSIDEEDRVGSLQLVDSTLYAELVLAHPYADSPEWAESTDGGLTWSPSVWSGPASWDVAEFDRTACRSDGWCFRRGTEEILERRPGGEWRTSFALTSNQRDVLRYRVGSSPSFGWAVVVRVGEAEHVVFTARDQGVVVLDGDGSWHRVGVLDITPTDISGMVWPLRLAEQMLWVAALVAFVAVLIRTPGPSTGLSGWQRFSTFLALLLVSGFLMVASLFAWFIGIQDRSDPLGLALILFALMAAAVGAPFLLMRSREIPVRRVRRRPLSGGE